MLFIILENKKECDNMKKKFISLFTTMALLMSLMSAFAVTASAEGEIIQISNLTQLK